MSSIILCFILVTIDNFDYKTLIAESLFERIVLRPQHYEIETQQKDMRIDMIYAIKGYLLNETAANDNAAYLNSRSNKKQYFIEEKYQHKNYQPNS